MSTYKHTDSVLFCLSVTLIVYGVELWKLWNIKQFLFIVSIALRAALRKEVRGHSFEKLAIWHPLSRFFSPLLHYLSYLTWLNNFGTGARFLYANEAAIHDLVRFHPPRASRLPSGSLASQKSSDFVRGSPVSSSLWLEAETLWTPRVTSDYSLAKSFHLLSNQLKVTPESCMLLPERDPGNIQPRFHNFWLVTRFPRSRKFAKFL